MVTLQPSLGFYYPLSEGYFELGIFLEGVKEFDTRWIGWAGVNVPDEVGQKALVKALDEKVLNLVYLSSLSQFENH